MWIAVLTAWLASSSPPATIPADVTRCIGERKMYVVAPEFFESFEIDGPNGKRERAYQILDRDGDATGYLLVTPSSCRIIVLVTPGQILTFDPSTKPTLAELRSLLKWAGYRELDKGPIVAHSFLRDGNAVWFYDGTTMQIIDLPSGVVRRVDVK